MKTKAFVLVLGLCLIPFAAQAQSPRVTVRPGATLEFDGDSTVRRFTCKAKAVPVRVQASGALAPEALAGVTLELAKKQLDCGDGTMNDHMLKALQADKHESIRFVMSSVEAGAAKDGAVPMRVKGDLTISGQTRPVVLEASSRAADDGSLRVEGRHAVKMTDWGVKPPTLMLGTIKVKDTAVVRFDLTLEAK